MIITVVMINRGGLQNPITFEIERAVLWEPEAGDVVALQKRGNIVVTAIFPESYPLPEQINELFQAGVRQIDIYLRE